MVNVIKYCFCIQALFFAACIYGQSNYPIRHYSFDDGLTQSTITDIIQDKNGCIWIGTFDGLVKFDGYEFQNYKVLSNNFSIATSNRIDYIKEDRYGRFWIESFDDLYCFNPVDQTFSDIPHINEGKSFLTSIDRVKIMPSGKVWLLNNKKGAICILDSLFNKRVYPEILNLKSHTVFEDQSQNTWLLTEKGLGFIAKDNEESIRFTFQDDDDKTNLNQPFFTYYETNKHIWFGSYKGTVWKYSKSAKTFREITLSTISNIIGITPLNDDKLFIQSASDGFFTYTISSQKFKHYNGKNINGLETRRLRIIHLDAPSQVWMSSDKLGISKFNFETEQLKHYPATINDVSAVDRPLNPFVLKDNDGGLWVHPRGGGFSFYNREDDSLEPFYNTNDQPNRRISNIIRAALIDNQNNLWFASKSLGIEKVSLGQSQFKVVKPVVKSISEISNSIRAMYQDKNGYIWIATKEKRLLICDEKLQILGNMSPEGKLVKDAIWPHAFYSIAEGKENTIWLGSKGSGLYRLKPKARLLSFDVANFIHNSADKYSISSNNIYGISEDAHNNIWIATLGGGLNILNTKADEIQFINHNNALNNYPIELCQRVRTVKVGPNGIIYAGTTNGLLTCDSRFIKPEDIHFKHYHRSSQNKNSFKSNEIIDIHIADNNEVYLASFGGGLIKVSALDEHGYPETFESFHMKDGLPSELLLSINSDNAGNLWLTTENDLVRYMPTKKLFERFIEIERKLSGNIFAEATSAHLFSGELMYGTIDGLVKFNPNKIGYDRYVPYLQLSNFKISKRRSSDSPKDTVLKAIDVMSDIVLNYNQNFFSLEFNAYDYNNTSNIIYAYKLDGFDDDWSYTSKQRFVNYTNIPKGDYVFKIKSTNSKGIWVDNERRLAIKIKPPLWNTPIAYMVYFLIVGLLIWVVNRHYIMLFRLRSEMKMQKEMTDMKMKFFTDISHEIRTPLTLISAPVEYMINDSRTPEDAKKQLSFIAQSTERLLKLVNQILDYRKVQEEKLRVTSINLGHFAQKICLDFVELAQERKINFEYGNLASEAIVWGNQDELEKLLINLISNAFKFNKAGNTVVVSVTKTDQFTTLHVQDNGAGIPKAKQKELFNRFASFNEQSSNPSTGIGLSIVKEVCDKHGAKLILESDTDCGCNFDIRFNIGYEHFPESVKIILEEPRIKEETPKENEEVASTSNEPSNQTQEKYSILVVEDDEKLRSFIKSILEEDYNVFEAVDGKEGFNQAVKHAPDFIVSDIMMPNRSGIDLLKSLRNEESTSHIPIILLTAKTTIENKLEGLASGADDYITKPFSVAYFKARIQNLIKQRKLLQAIYGADINLANSKVSRPNFITDSDENFIEKVYDLIHLNIDRSDFTVEELGRLLGMSRTSFYNKLKSLTGMTPVELIRNQRLNRATQLLAEKNLLIKEVCYLVGFNDLKYFSKCFKTKYGLTPMQYRTNSRSNANETYNQILD